MNFDQIMYTKNSFRFHFKQKKLNHSIKKQIKFKKKTPPDIFCENRKKTQKIPGTPSHFRFSQEESVNGRKNP